MIVDYINRINKFSELSNTTFEMEDVFTFHGDGEGDNEYSSDSTSQTCLEDYILYCENQIKLAKELLEKGSYDKS